MLTEKQDIFISRNTNLNTPYLLVDLDIVEENYLNLTKAMSFAVCYYAVKCNSSPFIIRKLLNLGSRFEVASIYEMDLCIKNGVPVGDIHYGNPIKSSEDIEYAHKRGVHSFTIDSQMELDKIATKAPNTKISFRMSTDGKGAVFGLDRKFGADEEEILALMISAHDRGLTPYGVSFHVGSQQLDPDAWIRALKRVANIFSEAKKHGITPRLVNLGGGWPAKYNSNCNFDVYKYDINDYVKDIRPSFRELFSPDVSVVIEPGRFLAADAGVIVSRVLLIKDASKSRKNRWVYSDIGRFNGLHDAGIVLYPIITSKDNSEKIPTILAGPTCDGDDILYDEHHDLHLPSSLEENDKLIIFGTGAYTTSFSTVGFNGFPALSEIYI